MWLWRHLNKHTVAICCINHTPGADGERKTVVGLALRTVKLPFTFHSHTDLGLTISIIGRSTERFSISSLNTWQVFRTKYVSVPGAVIRDKHPVGVNLPKARIRLQTAARSSFAVCVCGEDVPQVMQMVDSRSEYIVSY